LSTSSKISSFKISHFALCHSTWLHHCLYTHTHARTYAHGLLSDINFWPDDEERSQSKCRWYYSNKVYCCADWNIVLYCTVAVQSGALCRHKIAHSINCATDSTLPPSDIASIHGQCAADFTNLNADETKVSSTILTTYRLNKSKSLDSHVLWPTLRLLLTVPYCHITPQSVLSKNMPHVPAVTLWLLMPVGRNTSNSSLQLNASVDFSHHILYNYIYALYPLKLHTL
jgi:hypothetical protein